MDRSFSPSRVNLEEAAELVAVRAALGPAQTKQANNFSSIGKYLNDNPGLRNSLIGGGLGAGAGLLSGALSNKEDKEWGRRAMLGAGLGAGIGAASHYAPKLWNAATTDPTQEKMDRVRDAFQTAQGANTTDSSWTDSFPFLSRIADRVSPSPSVESLPEGVRQQVQQDLKDLSASGYDTTNVLNSVKPSPANQLTSMATNTLLGAAEPAAMAGAGYGAGAIADKVVNAMPQNPRTALKGLTDFDAISPPLRDLAKQRQDIALKTPEPTLGSKYKHLRSALKGGLQGPDGAVNPSMMDKAKHFKKLLQGRTPTIAEKNLMDQLRQIPKPQSTKFRRAGGLGGAAAGLLMKLFPPEKVQNVLN